MDSPYMTRDALSTVARKASSMDFTLTVSTLMVLPPERVDISVKAGNQFFNPGESHGVFPFTNMLMFTFAPLVIISHHADTINNISQAIFLPMAVCLHSRADELPCAFAWSLYLFHILNDLVCNTRCHRLRFEPVAMSAFREY